MKHVQAIQRRQYRIMISSAYSSYMTRLPADLLSIDVRLELSNRRSREQASSRIEAWFKYRAGPASKADSRVIVTFEREACRYNYCTADHNSSRWFRGSLSIVLVVALLDHHRADFKLEKVEEGGTEKHSEKVSARRVYARSLLRCIETDEDAKTADEASRLEETKAG